MACPTCDRTMQNLGVEGQRIFWCASCGTIKSIATDFVNISTPYIVRHPDQIGYFVKERPDPAVYHDLGGEGG